MTTRKRIIIGTVTAVIVVGIFLFYSQLPRMSQRTVKAIAAETSRPPTASIRFAGSDFRVNGMSAFSSVTVLCDEEVPFELVSNTAPGNGEVWALFVVPRMPDAVEHDFKLVDWNVDRVFEINPNEKSKRKNSYHGELAHNLHSGTYKVRYYIRSEKFENGDWTLPVVHYLGEGELTVPGPEDTTSRCDFIPLENKDTFDPEGFQ